ncbi:MAG: VWA domain-containing protein [Candidatus Angelobacter sp.]
MSVFGLEVRKMVCALALLAIPVLAQQTIPDAPKPKVPAQFPGNAPAAPANAHPEQPAAPAPTSTPTPYAQDMQGVVTGRNQLPTFSVSVNFVQVPVTVKDSQGHLVSGLGPQDFTVYENGVPQRLRFFTGDPFPLSAAVVLDTDLPSSTLRKVNQTLPALVGAFSEFDEVALYRYGHTVQQVSSFTGAGSVSTTTLAKIKRPGREGGPPMGGTMSGGPTINGHEGVPGMTNNSEAPPPVQESYVLNDAILRAAQDLSRRDKTRRRIIFVISDGREIGSNARYDEVRKVLLSNNIAIYAMGVDTAAIPIYDRLGRIRVPGFGYGNILPRYVSDTAGEMYAAFDRGTIEQAYGKLTDMARNQYTLGYTTRATASSSYRSIEVKVHRPNLTVTAKQGYFPLPPQRPVVR